MYRLALTSAGPYVGKSTLARVLEQQHGYTIASHSNTLVEHFCQMMNATQHTDLTPMLVYANKAQYRKQLQDYARLIEFDSKTKYIEETLDWAWCRNNPDGTSYWDGSVPVVFDNIRSDDQALFLRHMDFKIIGLTVPYAVRVQRAAEQGCSKERLDLALQDKAERGIDPRLIDLTVDTNRPVFDIAAEIMGSYLGTGTIERIG